MAVVSFTCTVSEKGKVVWFVVLRGWVGGERNHGPQTLNVFVFMPSWRLFFLKTAETIYNSVTEA